MISNMISTFSNILLIVLVNHVLQTVLANVSELYVIPPEIVITEISKADSYRNINVSQLGNEEKDEYFSEIGKDIILGESILGIVLKCSAPYPVYWTMNNSIEVIDDSFVPFSFPEISTYTTREMITPDSSDENRKYSATLKFWSLSSAMTNDYSCRSVKNKAIESSRYVFITGYSQNYLLYAGRTFTISIGSKQQVVTCPCKIITPDMGDIQLKLFKERNVLDGTLGLENWELLSTNESISYDARQGYSLIVSDLPEILGWYKCTADDSNDNDEVHFGILTSENSAAIDDKSQPRMILHGTASLKIDDENGVIQCCSNGEKPPFIKILFCNNPPECEMSRPTAAIKRKSHWGWGSNHVKNCSQEIVYSRTSFWLKCEGEGIDLLEIYSFYFLNISEISQQSKHESDRHFYRQFPSYSLYPVRTQRIPAERLLFVSIDYMGYGHHSFYNDYPIEKSRVFSGDTVRFHCYMSTYMFAAGSFWIVVWKNGTSKKLPNTRNRYDPQAGDGRLRLKMDTTMVSVQCFAPVWNNTEWISKSLQLEVQESSPPVPQNGNIESLKWTVNDTNRELRCCFLGQPPPQIDWMKDGKILDSNEIFTIQINESISTLTFLHKITHDVHGEFSCNGRNLAGTSTKLFLVYIEDPDTSHVIIIASVILGVIISGILGFIVFKVVQQKRFLNQCDAGTTTYQSSTDLSP